MLRFALVVGSALAAVACLVQTARADAPTSRPATSQPRARTVAPDRNSPAGLRLDELTFELGLEGRFDRRTYNYRSGPRLSPYYRGIEQTRRFEETIGVRAAGTAIDPRVLTFDLSGSWGLSQEWYHETRPGRDRDEHPHGDLLEYDLNFTLLPQGMLSASAYAQRSNGRLPRAFLPSLDRTFERYGVDLLLNHRTVPMRLSFEHTFEDLDSGFTGWLRDYEQRGRDTLRYEATWQIEDNHALRFEYEYDDRRESYSGTFNRFDTNRHYFVLDHTLRFGPEQRSLLQTTLRYQDESGELARDIAEWSTRLRLQHTQRLATDYRVQYLHEGYFDLGTDTWRGEAGVSYEFSEHLLGTAQFYGYRQQDDRNVDYNEWGANGSLSYRRDNAWGHFSAQVNYHHADSDTDSGLRRGVVISESVTLRDPRLGVLAHQNVNPLSVVVTNVERTRIYRLGRDYYLVPLGRYVGLRRVRTGMIRDGQTVLVSYVYRVARDYENTRDRVDWRVQQRFDFGLTPYYAGSIQSEQLDHAGYLSYRARDVNRHRIGLQFQRRRWSAGLEYEYNDDAIDPYQALHLNTDAVLVQKANWQLDGQAAISRYWFDGTQWLDARHTTLFDGGLSCRHLLARGLETTAAALYRYEDDSLLGITHGVDLSAAVVWRIGRFSLRLEAEYDALRLPHSKEDGFSVWLKLSREIPVIARKGS